MVISEGVSRNDECDALSQVLISLHSAISHNLTTTNSVMMNLQAAIDTKEADVKRLKTYQTFLSAIHNETTPDIQELETDCEDLAVDCCQVIYSNYSLVLSIYD